MARHKNRSNRQNRFARIPGPQIQRSVFNRSHGHKTTMDAGFLVPIFVDEVLPGDTFTMRSTAFGRLATVIYPLMDSMYLDTQWFFISNRLLWSNWEKFMGEQANPGDSTDFLVPEITFNTVTENSLADYMGLPVGDFTANGGITVSALPFRAYALTFNEWYRDQNMVNSTPFNLDDGPDASTDYPLLVRGKRHDYFTSCLPWPQKGDPVELPLGGQAQLGGLGPVLGIGALNQSYTAGGAVYETSSSQATNFASQMGTGGSNVVIEEDVNNPGYPAVYANFNSPNSTAYADLSTATAATVNSIRQSFQVQKVLERDARGGTRYAEIVRSHFGVISPDARLQRPEYLGGSSTPIMLHSVANTTGVDGQTAQASLSAYGTVAGGGGGWRRSFTEHGWVICLASLRADLNYQQGIERMWNRSTRFDHYFPAFAHLGEQAVLNKEIYAQGDTHVDENEVFGYQERWAEYRYKPGRISGLFRSTAAQSLDAWHLAQEFASLPVLDEAFISEAPPVDRVIAVQDEPHLIADFFFDFKCARPMPTYSVPGLIDHF